MYLKFYQLKEFPFSLTCQERYFYASSIHAEALANMLYVVQQRKGMVLITGEVGSGKTFLSNMLGARLGPGCSTVQMHAPPQSVKQFYRAFSEQLGSQTRSTDDRHGLVSDLREHLARMHQRSRLVALVLDEAQDLSAPVLEEVRLLWNWEDAGQRLVQIVLVAQPELREVIAQPGWEPLRQRIVLSYHLGCLPPEDTAAYIDHRLRVAGAENGQVEFTDQAKAYIHAAANGVPRLINVVCDNALLVGYANGTRRIDQCLVADVLRNMTCWDLRVPDSCPVPAGTGGNAEVSRRDESRLGPP